MNSTRQEPYSDFERSLTALRDRLALCLTRVDALQADADLPEEPRREALAFNLERAAWTSIELAQAWVIEKRLGFPKKETEAIDILMREGILPPEVARPLRQACDYRSLSARAPERVDWDHAGTETAIASFRVWKDFITLFVEGRRV